MSSVSLSSDGGRLATTIACSLAKNGVPAEKARKYGAFAMEMHRYLAENPKASEAVGVICDTYDAYDGSKKIFTAAKYLRNGAALGLKSAKPGFRSFGASGAGAVISVFHSRFQTLAKRQGIELNECMMAVSELALSIGTAGTGAVTSVTGFGLVLAGIGIVSTWNASQAAVQACSWGDTSR